MRTTVSSGGFLVVVGLVLGIAMAYGMFVLEHDTPASQLPQSLTAGSPPEAVTLNANAGDAARGRVPYERECATCHGSDGKGDVPLHGGILNTYYRDDRVLAGLIRNGVGTMPSTSSSLMSDQQVADTIAFMRSLP